MIDSFESAKECLIDITLFIDIKTHECWLLTNKDKKNVETAANVYQSTYLHFYAFNTSLIYQMIRVQNYN